MFLLNIEIKKLILLFLKYKEMDQIEELIIAESETLSHSDIPSVCLNIQFNLIALKNINKKHEDNYCDVKKLINYSVENLKSGAFGYDAINYSKIENVLNYLSHKERVSVLKYGLSILTKELPEYDKEWFIRRINVEKIADIFKNKEILNYPKAFFLYCSLNITHLTLVFLVSFFIVYLVLLPTRNVYFQLFELDYQPYSNDFLYNHALNVLTLFSGLSNGLIIRPLSPFAVLIIIFSKVLFIVIIVNFVYRKVTDKISIK